MAADKFVLSEFAFTTYIVTLFTIITVGLAGNILAVVVLTTPSHRHKSLTPFLINLATADILVCLLGYTIAGSYNMVLAGEQSIALEAPASCSWIAFINAFTGLASIGTLTIMTFLTYKNVTQLFVASTGRMNTCSVALVLTGIWFYALVLSVPPAFGWSQFVAIDSKISCHPDWASQEPRDVAYIIFLVSFGFFLPLTVIIHCSVGIIRYTYHTRSSAEIQNSSIAQTKKTTRIVLVAMLAFFVSWSFYAVISLMATIKGRSIISPGIALIPEMLAKSSAVYNPLVYVVMNRSFRRTLLRLLGRSQSPNRIEVRPGRIFPIQN